MVKYDFMMMMSFIPVQKYGHYLQSEDFTGIYKYSDRHTRIVKKIWHAKQKTLSLAVDWLKMKIGQVAQLSSVFR